MNRSRPSRTILCAVLAAASLLLIGSRDEDRAERRQRIKQMTPAQKTELAQKHKRFKRLPREKRDQLRVLHKRLEAEPDGPALREVMRHYCDWLETLLLYERSDLERLPIDQRVETIKEKRYGGQDARAIRQWAEAHFEKHGLSARKLFADFWTKQVRSWERRRQAQARDNRGMPKPAPSSPRDQAHTRDRIETSLAKDFRLEDADLAALHDRLSPARAKWFERLSPTQQRRWVARKVLDVIRPRRPPEVISDEQLAEFFKSTSLSDQQRERLMRLPGDEMYGELVQWYRRVNSPGFPPGGPGRRRPNWEPPFGRLRRHVGPHGEPPDARERPDGHRAEQPGPDAPTHPDPGPPPGDWRD